MDITEAIRILEAAGFTVAPKEETPVDRLYTHGERWENNPQVFMAEIAGSEPEMAQAMYEVDLDRLMQGWGDQTLADIDFSGSDIFHLARDSKLHREVTHAAQREIQRRRPLVHRQSHGDPA